MKKVLAIFTSILFTLLLIDNVSALTIDGINFDKPECNQDIIDEGKKNLKNISYTLTYEPNVVDREGNSLEGYFNLEMSNIPTGYEVKIFRDKNGTYNLDSSSNSTFVKGGVYSLEFYNNSCSTTIKKMNVFIPLYKNFCYEGQDCNTNPWFDGTYENKTLIDKKEEKIKANKLLVVIFIILILIICLLIFVVIKRRKDNEKEL